MKTEGQRRFAKANRDGQRRERGGRSGASDPISTIATFGFPPRPPAKLDQVLDATERCLVRHGLRRTSMTDIAREMGVARPTLYRQVASSEEAVALVVARQIYRLLDDAAALLAQGAGPDTFIDMTVRAVTSTLDHPVAHRILDHEPELIGEVMTNGQLPGYIEQVAGVLVPAVEAAMNCGSIRPSDPRLAASLIVRLLAVLVLAPPGGDELERLVRFTLEPVLQPEPSPTIARTSR